MTQLSAKTALINTPSPDTITAKNALSAQYDFLNEMLQAPEIDINCAATINIGSQVTSRLRIVNTAVTITSLGTVYRSPILLRAGNSYLFAHNATSLICPGGQNLTVQAGDLLLATMKSSTSGTADGWQIAVISRADGGALFTGPIRLLGASPIVLEGATDNAYKTTFAVTDPTANRTITFPNADVDLTAVRAADNSNAGYSRFATGAEALAGLITNAVVTPAGLSWPRAFSSNGYQRFPGTPGLLVQWGRSGNLGDIGSGSKFVQLTFPIAFNGLLIVIPVTIVANVNASCVPMEWDTAQSNNTTAGFRFHETEAAIQGPLYIGYVAIGY